MKKSLLLFQLTSLLSLPSLNCILLCRKQQIQVIKIVQQEEIHIFCYSGMHSNDKLEMLRSLATGNRLFLVLPVMVLVMSLMTTCRVATAELVGSCLFRQGEMVAVAVYPTLPFTSAEATLLTTVQCLDRAVAEVVLEPEGLLPPDPQPQHLLDEQVGVYGVECG